MPNRFNIPLRSRVLTLVGLAAGITYLDRVCISVAAPDIMSALHLSKMQMGYVFGTFSVAYGLAEVPMGWLSDRWGQRRMLTCIVALWSVFTALTGLMWEYHGLLVVRFLFGAVEAGAFPAMARALGEWFQPTDRGRANGIMWMGARLGGSISPILATVVIAWYGWRLPFALFGMVGGSWCLLFWHLYRDDPATHPKATPADLEYSRRNVRPPASERQGSTPWRKLAASKNLWAIFWMYSATSYGFWFLITWLPFYLIQQQHLSPQRAGFYAGLPLGVGAIGNVVGGSLSDLLVRRIGSLKWGRRIVGLGGYLLSALGFGAAAAMHQALPAVICLMLGEVGLDLATPVAWAVCFEVGGNYSGTVSAFMNSASSATAFISPLAAAWIYTRYHSFNPLLLSAGIVYFLASLLWFKIDASKAIVPVNENQATSGG